MSTARRCQPSRRATYCSTGSASKNSFAIRRSGPSGTVSSVPCQDAGVPRSASFCRSASAGLVSTRWISSASAKPAMPSCGAQKIGHERAAPGTELDQHDPAGLPHPVPGVGAPRADQLAEDLADLGRGDEIALPAQGVAPGVVAIFGIAVRRRHETGDGNRPATRDPLPQLLAEWSHRGNARRTSQIPTRRTGIDRSCPIVAPPNRKPRWASGWRNNSAKPRATA